MNKTLVLALGVTCVALIGCGQSQQQTDNAKTGETELASKPAEQSPPPTQTAPTTQSEPPTTVVTPPAGGQQSQPAKETAQKPATQKPASQTTETKPIPKEPEPPKMVSIPIGTSVVVALETHLRTDSNKTGDAFVARTTDAIRVDDMTVIPAGTQVRGKLTHVEEPHRTAGKAQMTLAFEQFVDANGAVYNISAEPIAMEAEGDKVSDEGKVAAGAVVGGIIGALTSKKKTKGAATGAVAGAAAGGAIALATKGQQLDLPPGQQFSFELTAPVEVPASQLTAGK